MRDTNDDTEMKRRLLKLLTALSLLLCLATVAVWAWSFHEGVTSAPSTAAMQAELARPVGQLQFGGVAFGEMIPFFQDLFRGRFEIEVDWAALEASGVRRDSLVHVGLLNNVRLGEMIAAVTRATGRAGFITRGDVVYISTATALEQRDPAAIGGSREGGARRYGAGMLPPWEVVSGARRWTLTAARGTLGLSVTPTDPASVYQQPTAGARLDHDVIAFGGFSVARRRYPFDDGSVAVPLWALAAITAVAPLRRLWRAVRQARRQSRGRCRGCGYDLTGNVSGVCPECGTVAAAARF